jgi:hypothetical protein
VPLDSTLVALPVDDEAPRLNKFPARLYIGNPEELVFRIMEPRR